MNRNCRRPRKPLKTPGLIVLCAGLLIIAALVLPPVVWVFALGAALVLGGILLIK
ncbi:MAG: hypothetical protein LBN97_04800 [Oscillospiraceae bacterium]|jgi:uncharacterized membrane protein HdeD (DUF308 family)|nr:hypothetical protein [Oscillospiraceae bacterium]